MKQTLGFIAGSLAAIGIAAGAYFATRTSGAPAFVPASSNASAMAAAPAPATPSQTFVSGSLEADIATPVTVFVMARDASVKGHPFLAKRIDVQKFPVEFALTSDNVMADGQPPAQLQLEARVDRDGDVVTKEKDAPKAVLGGVALGTSGVRLHLH